MERSRELPSRKEIGDNLQSLRIAAGYETAQSFADAVGFNVGTYTGYEQGKGMFSYEKAWIMADALGCSMDALGGRRPPREYADQQQAQLNAMYDQLEDTGKSAAIGSVRGILDQQERQRVREKTEAEGLGADSRRYA